MTFDSVVVIDVKLGASRISPLKKDSVTVIDVNEPFILGLPLPLNCMVLNLLVLNMGNNLPSLLCQSYYSLKIAMPYKFYIDLFNKKSTLVGVLCWRVIRFIFFQFLTFFLLHIILLLFITFLPVNHISHFVCLKYLAKNS